MGEYIGVPAVELLEDGRLLKLLNDFSFKDAAALTWLAPKGALIDGASIPQALWTIVGGPLEGKYRNASILHDWYCDKRSRPWRAVHRMFHEGMLVSGVSSAKARIMYLAVYYGGPRWAESTVANNQLDTNLAGGGGANFRSFAPKRGGQASAPASAQHAATRPQAYVKDIDPGEFKALLARVKRDKAGPDDIDALVDQQTEHLIK
jgi:hypothetical protein